MHRLSDFDYDLPSAQIAQHPVAERSASRLLVLDRATGATRHLHFHDLIDLMPSGDVLVTNDSRVLPARLHGQREGGQNAEILLVRETADGTWLAMAHPGGKLKRGRRVRFGEDSAVEIVDVLGGGMRRVRFTGALDANATLAKYGEVPLPPYIRRPAEPADRERYQTVYAQRPGSVAAPTAGLHFTQEMGKELFARGIRMAPVTLHIGPGTFKPVESEDIAAHVMHAEWYDIDPRVAERINKAKREQWGVWCVGTSAVRVLESAVDTNGHVRAGAGETSLFIRPPYDFKIANHLITNFHLPRSTLLMLVCAFGGYERVMTAYREAVKEGYRFYSYGDAMAIV